MEEAAESGVVETDPLIGTGVARSCESVKGPVAVMVPEIGTGVALSSVSVKPGLATVTDPETETEPDTGCVKADPSTVSGVFVISTSGVNMGI